MENFTKMALLIDADNTQLGKLEDVIREISTYGRIIVKRAYGNWKKETLKNWEFELKRLAIKAIQQFDYTASKNATDMALVVDAVDLLHTGNYDAFVIVASDSDYTPLAIRLHESGVYVFGVGERKTPEAFRNSCDEFILLENLNNRSVVLNPPTNSKAPQGRDDKPSAKNAEAAHEKSGKGDTKASTPEEWIDDISEIHKLLAIAADKYQNDDGYTNVSSAGTYIKRTKPDFSARTYGYEKLPALLRDFPEKYDVTSYKGEGTVTIIAYKCKQQTNESKGGLGLSR